MRNLRIPALPKKNSTNEKNAPESKWRKIIARLWKQKFYRLPPRQ
ncbi:MAG: hypothetical protein RR595_12015 [Lysinibacillus sp.]